MCRCIVFVCLVCVHVLKPVLYERGNVCVCVCVCVYKYCGKIYVYLGKSVCVLICVWVCICVYICIHVSVLYV